MTAAAVKRDGTGGGARSAARLAAVQALYEIDVTGTSADAILTRRETALLIDDEAAEILVAPDDAWVRDVVKGVLLRRQEIDDLLAGALAANWPLGRLDKTLKCIMRAGVYELIARPDVPTAAVINEYIDLAHAFYHGDEPGFVNGVLDRVARRMRGGAAAAP